MLELYKGQLSMSDLNLMSLRELLILRDTRAKRYEKERKMIEDENKRKEQEAARLREAQSRQKIRNSITKR